MNQQVIPEGAALERPHLSGSRELRERDPTLYKAVQDVHAALRQDLLPIALQEQLFRALNPTVQRQMIAEVSGMDDSVLATFKQQMTLVDSILRRTFNEDGSLHGGEDADLAMSPKDVLNLSIKVSQMMLRELPKVYNMDRVQRMEAALFKVMGKHLTREQQTLFLQELDNQKSQV